MRLIRVGVIFDQKISVGGGYQQALNAALMVLKLPKELTKPVFFTTDKKNLLILETYGIKAINIKLSFFEKLREKFRRKILDKHVFKIIKKIEKYSPFEKKLIKHKIDIVYFLSPTDLSQGLEKLSYITTLWDLCHRDEPEFPEVRNSKEFERRDENFKKILPSATAIIVDSEVGKSNVINRYGVDESRVHIIPFQAAQVIRNAITSDNKKKILIKNKYNVNSYVFYPAQFWAHKNHIYILNGLHLLESKYGIKVSAIFSGNDMGNKHYVKSYAFKLKLTDRVHFAGYVSEEEMLELYRQSIALVMPTYFGPTNIPPLEAFKLGVPVLYSDKKGLRDQVGNAALLMDLKDPNSLAIHLKNLIETKDLRQKLIKLGYERYKYYEDIDRIKILKNIFEDFSTKRIAWE
jgi:glycosyltransferase involved in cell wall biosynthesis